MSNVVLEVMDDVAVKITNRAILTSNKVPNQ